MNKNTYRLIWDDARQTWMVAHEFAAARGKRSGSVKPGVAVLAGALASFGVAAQVPAPATLPTGGQIVAGQAAISQSGSAMTIQQDSAQAILNWNSFSIGSQASVTFLQPSSSAVALNRVVGSDPSAIYGSLSANGQVFLVNPSGVVFGPGARVDVGGLVASTLDMRDDDFLAGNHRFERNGATGSVVNQGELLGKYVALLAPEVRNEGVIVAKQGTAALAAGDAVTLNITGSDLVGVQVDRASIDTLVENRHLIQADAGTVILSAQSANDLLGRVVNSGAIAANGITTDGGTVRLVASSTIEHRGSIQADAGANGNGGDVVVIADLTNPDSRTTVSGTLSAKGGSDSGNGGFVETSGTHLKIEDSARIDTSAPNGQTGQWLLDPYDFTIAASGGDITGAALGSALASNDVTIQTTNTAVACTGATCGAGNSAGNGDIFVNDTVSWASASTLTLDAWRNIEVNQAISVTGTGGLTLKYGQQAGNSGNAAAYLLSAPINLASGATFQTQLGNDVGLMNYTIVNDRAALNSVFDGTNYVLGANISAGATPFTPISSFTSVFDGLGHTIDGLTIDTAVSNNSGLFAEIGSFISSNGEVRNLGLTNVNVTGTANWLGGIAGTNFGSIHHSYVTGNVGSAGGAGTLQTLGGLVGSNNGSIASSYSGATVTGANGDNDAVVGGLAGVNTRTSGSGGSISNSYATGTVSKVSGATTGAIGGLVGSNEAGGSISNSYASASVSAGTSTRQGGLVGMNGNNDAGTDSTIANSYYNSTLYAGNGIGDDVSATPQTVTAKTTAQLTAATVLADLGLSSVTWLRDSTTGYPVLRGIVYSASGAPTVIYIRLIPGSSIYGEAVNLTYGLFDQATGGTSIGDASPSGTVTWSGTLPTDTSNVGNYSLTYNGGITLGNAGYSLVAGNAVTWTVNPRPITVTAAAGQSKVYNGQGGADPALTYAVSAGTPLVNGDTLGGALARAAGSNVGTYAINQGTLANGNYDITFVADNFAITPKALTVTGTTATGKVYDATTAATINVGSLSGFVGTETVTATATGTFDSKDAGNRTATASYTLANGTNGGLATNYSLASTGGHAATITPKALTVTGTTATGKVYDATTAATFNVGSLSGFVGTETVTATATGTFDSKNAGNRTATASYTLANGTNGGLAANYSLASTGGHAATITPKALTVTGTTAAGKVYDATTAATINVGSLSGFVGTETVTATATGTFDSKNAGNRTATASYTLANGTNGGLATNYSLASTGGHAATITPKALTVTGTTAAGKVYDATTAATINVGSLSGFVGTETVTATATGTFDSKNAGNRTATASYTLANGTNGGLAANYSLASTGGHAAIITTKALALLDLTFAASPTDASATSVGVGDTVLITSASTAGAIFAGDTVSAVFNPNTNADKTITALTATAAGGPLYDVTANRPAALALAGADAANYTLTGATMRARVTAASSTSTSTTVAAVVNSGQSAGTQPQTTIAPRAPTTTVPPTTTTAAPPPAQISGTTRNPTPLPGQTVPISVPASDADAALDPTKPVAAVLVPASGEADIPTPTPKITVNANGTLSIEVTVPPGTPPGVYFIAVVGTDALGRSRAVIVPVVVRRRVAA